MTKTELLEQILAELKAIHALLETPADLPTPAGATERQAMETGTHPLSGRVYNPLTDTWDFPPRPSNDKAGSY